eukprot:COSAG06_NODE_1261_length_10074_cov_21.232882_3_plen_152_part_00
MFEGGIRVPGILEWPNKIHANRQTWFPACTTDYLPTILDILGVSHPHPTWASDGMTLLPLIEDRLPTPAGAAHPIRTKPLGWAQGQPPGVAGTPIHTDVPTQVAYMDNDLKMVRFRYQDTTRLPSIGQNRSIFIGNLGLFWIYFGRIIANA